MIMMSHYHEVQPYQTRDGSVIRELMHPSQQGNRQQSLAEATVKPGETTLLHRHHRSEEIYYIVQGKGRMQLDHDQFEVNSGDCICIPPGAAHCIHNTGHEALKILCCCSPPYSHEDTETL